MPHAPGGVLMVRRLNRALLERPMLLRRRCDCQGVLLRKFLITLLPAPPEGAFRAPYTSPQGLHRSFALRMEPSSAS